MGAISLHEVASLRILTFKFNLLSVSKVTKDLNFFVYFFLTFYVFQDFLPGKVKETGREEDGLYTIISAERKSENKIYHAFIAVTKESEDIWHKRMGYVSMQTLSKVSSFSNNMLLNKCEVCRF